MRKFLALLTVVLVMSVLASVAIADDCNAVRYVDNLDGTMTDCRSNLVWLTNANCKDMSNGITPSADGTLFWPDAMKWVKGLHTSTCGLSDNSAPGDWRLPTKTEMMAMTISGKKTGYTNPVLTNAAGTAKWTNLQTYDFQNVISSNYWTSTTYDLDPNLAWIHQMSTGMANLISPKSGSDSYVWPVRGGQSGEFGTVIIQ